MNPEVMAQVESYVSEGRSVRSNEETPEQIMERYRELSDSGDTISFLNKAVEEGVLENGRLKISPQQLQDNLKVLRSEMFGLTMTPEARARVQKSEVVRDRAGVFIKENGDYKNGRPGMFVAGNFLSDWAESLRDKEMGKV